MSNDLIMVRLAPDLDGFIDQDVLDMFKDSAVTYECIVNAQLIKTMRELIETMKEGK